MVNVKVVCGAEALFANYYNFYAFLFYLCFVSSVLLSISANSLLYKFFTSSRYHTYAYAVRLRTN